MKRSLVLVVLYLTCSIAFSQNLVPNPDFNLFSTCPGANEFTASDWNSLPEQLFGTPDYFNECSTSNTGVPDNWIGSQEPFTGAGYAGLITYVVGWQWIEHFTAELTSPTIEGGCYELTIRYSPGDNAGYSDNLGMLLSKGEPTWFIGQNPQMKKTIVQESKNEWHTMTFQYVSPGEETHVTIGNFNTQSESSYVAEGNIQWGYYYIDYVGVEYISEASESILVDLGEDIEVCETDFPVTLTSNLPNSHNVWSTTETGASIEVNSPGVYHLQSFVGCEYGMDTIEISIFDPEISLDDQFICEGMDSQTIDVDPSLGAYEWSDGTIGPSFTATEAGTYFVTLTYDCGEKEAQFNVAELQSIDIPPQEDVEFCESDLPFVLDFTDLDDGINEFLWSDGTDGSSVSINESGSYGVEISNDCFSEEISFNVNVSQSFPSFAPPFDSLICEGEQQIIYLGFPNVDYEWQDGSSAEFYIANSPGLYSVTVSNFCRTQVFEFEMVEAVESGLDLGEDISVCPGDSVLISSPDGSEMVWSNGVVGTETWVHVDGPLIGQAAGFCTTISDTIIITFDGVAPEISVPDSILLCVGDTISITASDDIAGVEFDWNTGSEDATIAVFEAGTYVVSGGNSCGIVSDSVVIVLAEVLPNLDLLDIYEICEGDTIELFIFTNGGAVEWSTGETEANIKVHNEGNYEISLANSCDTKVDSFQVVFIPELAPFDLGEDIGLCINATTEIEWTGSEGTYEWSTGENSEMIEINAPGLYWLDITGNCNAVSDTIEIIDLGEAPVIDLGDNLGICEGDSLEISIGSDIVDVVIWNTSSMEEVITIFTEGTFIVVGSNACGSDSDTIETIIYDQVATIDLGEDQLICPGDSLLLDLGTLPGEISWNTGEMGRSIYVSEAGSYIATLSSTCGSSIDTFQLDISAPAPAVDLGESEELCEGELLEFDINVEAGTSILWSNGEDVGENQFFESAVIWLELTNDCGTDRDSVELVIIPEIDAFALPADITICDDNSYELESGIVQEDISLVWSTTAAESSILVDESGWYWLQASNECFVATDSVRVDFIDAPQIFDLGMDDTICSGELIELKASQSGEFIYSWQDNSNTSNYTISESGTYVLEISNECGTQMDEIDILVLDSEVIDMPFEENYTLCNEIPLNVNLSSLFVNSVIWNDGSTELERLFTEPGDYFVQLINSCSDTLFSFTFTHEDCSEFIYIPNSFTPNDDGTNDYFTIWIPEDWLSPKIKVQLYNRWGEQVYYSEDPNFKWDGQFKGKSLNSGVYAFYFELEVEIAGERTMIRKTGDVTIVK